MKLPNGDLAVIPPAKLLDYLLSEAHPVGRSKARFFRAAGFVEANVALLEDGLLAVARTQEVVEHVSSPHGDKYVVDGPLTTPSSASLRVRTVWIIEPDVEYPRFVTAYPAPS